MRKANDIYLITSTDVNTTDVSKLSHPTNFILSCPKCGSSVNLTYALKLAPTLGIKMLDTFYCPCDRFQTMQLKQLIFYKNTFLSKIKLLLNMSSGLF